MSEQTPSDLRRRRTAPPTRLPGPRRGGRALRMRGALAALLGGLLLLLPGVAAAGQYLDRTVAGLREQPLYVDADARSVLKPETVQYLKGELPKVGTPMYVAVLPEAALQETGGSPDQLLARIPRGVRKEGVYALVAGRSFRAGATAGSGFRQGVIPGLASQAASSNPNDEDAAVVDFTERVRTAAAQGQAGTGGTPASSGESTRGGVGAGTILLGLLAVGAAGGGLLLVRANRRRKERERRELEQVKQTAQEDLIALGDDIGFLDIDVQLPGAAEEARKQHAAAVAAYERAAAALDRARSPAEVAPVSAALRRAASR